MSVGRLKACSPDGLGDVVSLCSQTTVFDTVPPCRRVSRERHCTQTVVYWFVSNLTLSSVSIAMYASGVRVPKVAAWRSLFRM